MELVSGRLRTAREDYETRYGNPKRDEVVVPSSGNVFTDLGRRDAGEKQTRLRRAVEINQIIRGRRRLSQTAAARLLEIDQPKISALVNYRSRVFR